MSQITLSRCDNCGLTVDGYSPNGWFKLRLSRTGDDLYGDGPQASVCSDDCLYSWIRFKANDALYQHKHRYDAPKKRGK